MNAKKAHELLNGSFWLENEDFNPGGAWGYYSAVFQGLPFSTHNFLKRVLLNPNRENLGIGGESITTRLGSIAVKAMYRRPDHLSHSKFFTEAESEISLVLESLAGVAVDTVVSSAQPATFRFDRLNEKAVCQFQDALDLREYPAYQTKSYHATKKTLSSIEILLEGSNRLREEGYVPDLAYSSGNLRYAPDGSLVLIDVMPGYAEGNRLIDDGVSLLHGTQTRLHELEQVLDD